MQRTSFWAGLAVVCTALVGCGESTSPAPTASTTGSTASTGGPEKTIFDFLEAVRLGDDAKAGGMLTTLAQQKTAELDMVVAPPGSDTAQFQVGAVEMVSDAGARVASTWSDLDQEGKRRNDNITWILRLQDGQWRIAGMATNLFADQDPVVLNFENPQEMLDRQQQAEEEATRRATQAQQQATRPQDPFQGERK